MQSDLITTTFKITQFYGQHVTKRVEQLFITYERHLMTRPDGRALPIFRRLIFRAIAQNPPEIIP